MKVTEGSFVEGEVTKMEATGSITEVGSVTNTIEITGGPDCAESNYTITKDEGTLTITEATVKITITAQNASKKYDGTPLTAPKPIVSGLPEGYRVEATVEGSVTNVNDTKSGNNVVTSYKIYDENGKEVTNQFNKEEVQLVPGTLTIEPREVYLTSASATRTYNGQALTKDKVTISGDGFISGEGATFDVTGTRTNVGSSKNTFDYTLNSDSTKAATKASLFTSYKGRTTLASNYDISKVYGSLTVNPKTITVITSDGTKTYDGTALTAKGKLTGLVSGETVTFRTTGSQTNVGSSENGYVLKWNGTAKRSNYVVREILGTLTVTAANVVPGAPGTPAGPGGPATFLGRTPDGPPTDIVEYDPPLTDIEEPTTPLSRFDGA